MRVVLDTNVIVSAHIYPENVPGAILERWSADAFELIVSTSLLDEYRRVMGYERIQPLHGLTNEEIDRSIDRLKEGGTSVIPGPRKNVVAADPDDGIFVACAVAGQADYIVSGDRHLLDLGQHEGIRIIRPAIFLTLLEYER